MSREFEIVRPPVEPLIEERRIWSQWQQWFQLAFDYINNTVFRPETTGDVSATIKPNESYHGVTSLTAPRTLTLPPTKGISDGHILVVQDESGSAGVSTITIDADGSETINGGASVTITTNFGRRTLVKRGSGTWFSE